jgi:uncharacterized ubiquitin-like protein YukD
MFYLRQSGLNLNYHTFIKLHVILYFILQSLKKVKMSRRRTSTYKNVNYQKLQGDDNEFTDSQVGLP